MQFNRWHMMGGGLFLGGAVLVALALFPSPSALLPAATASAEPKPVFTATPEPLIPTATMPLLSATATTPLPSATAQLLMLSATADVTTSPTPDSLPIAQDFHFPELELWRLGVSVPLNSPTVYDLAALRVGWVMNWNAFRAPPVPAGVKFAQTVRFKGGVLKPDAATLTAIAAANPGATWLISNEADVRWQDNVTPEVYITLYHEAYSAIKVGDPSAIVAAGGIAQPTPLRFRYLDLILEGYAQVYGEPLPAQAWHIHNYMLREERDSWGVDIPPGLPDATGMLYEIDDSGNLDVFRSQIWAFRRWMAERGYGGQPLLVSEYGIPMPEDYGFPLERVQTFLSETWSFFLTATDAGLGNSADSGRLVQAWCWYSLGDPTYATGNLVNLDSFAWTPLGRAWMRLVE